MPEAAPAARAEARSTTVDLLKVGAAHLIVWHHLAFYGPMSDHAAALWPALADALSRHGRLAVPVFLVIGGYLAARSLAPAGRLVGDASLGSRLVDRHLRLSVPLGVVVAFAAAAALVADALMDHDAIPVVEDGWQFLAHLLLLQGLLGVEALSAGVWYVAIDFQLHAVLLLLLAGARRTERHVDPAGLRAPLGPLAVAALGTLALVVFNRQPALDDTAFYFFGAYALGALVAWWTPTTLGRRARVGMAAAVVAVVALALWIDWRERVLVAALTAAVLAVRLGLQQQGARGPRTLAPRPGTAERLRRWSDRSYALFLVHFPIFLLVNAVFTRWVPPEAVPQALGLLLTWALSVAAAGLFHERVERPLGRWIAALRPPRDAVGGIA